MSPTCSVASGSRAPWREPMLWLVLALPLSVLVAAGITLHVAWGGTDAVRDPVRRSAQVQTTDLRSERGALALRARAELAVDRVGGNARLTLLGVADPARLDLVLAHPIDASRDRHATLARDGDAWIVQIPSAPHAWLLQLTPADGAWRLVGRLGPRQREASLRPALRE